MPSFLRRTSQSGGRISSFIHNLSRPNSPEPGSNPYTQLSSGKPIEEETQPKYSSSVFYGAKLGERLNNNRYEVVAKLGYGMTATVWLARDLQASSNKNGRKYVAIKINVNSLTTDFLKGRREIAKKLLSGDPEHRGYGHVRFMLESFTLKTKNGEHFCLVYDVLREPINECMDRFPGHLFSSDKLRKLLPALLKGLDYMHDVCHVVHTDLKPDNIMMGLGDDPNAVLDRFVKYQMDHPCARKPPDSDGHVIYQSSSDLLCTSEDPKSADITDAVLNSAKITDIGLAEWGDRGLHHKAIQSNAFTAPEVLLGAGWSYPADIWNLGVMIWDLIETCGLFDSIDTRPGYYHADQHLGLMIALLGPPPKSLLDRGLKTSNYFDYDRETEQWIFKRKNLVEKYKSGVSFDAMVTRMRGENKESFIDFAKKMIAWEPDERWTAAQLLDHPWLKVRPTGGPIIVDAKNGGSTANADAEAYSRAHSNSASQPSTPGLYPVSPTSATGFFSRNRENAKSHTFASTPSSANSSRAGSRDRSKSTPTIHNYNGNNNNNHNNSSSSSFMIPRSVPTPGTLSKVNTNSTLGSDLYLNMSDIKETLPSNPSTTDSPISPQQPESTIGTPTTGSGEKGLGLFTRANRTSTAPVISVHKPKEDDIPE